MPTITVKNIPNDIYEKLKKSAEASRRSINSEIIFCIERVVQSRQINPDLLLANARRLRAKTSTFPIMDDEFNQAKIAGRL
ncbi:MAG: Arc family DNA-binding protein [Anaerolineales bacterium]|nr:Arc family DNA-binding protein [Anaerolineales bacterium]